MNIILRYSFVALMAMFMGNAFADEFKVTFKDCGDTSDSGDLQTELSEIVAEGASIFSAVEASGVYQARAGRGIKLGTSKRAASLILTLSPPIKISAIKFTARKFNDSEHAITVNGKDFTELDGDFKEYTVELDGSGVDKISITTPEKRAYITTMTIIGEVEENINAFTVDGMNYTVNSFNEKTVAVSKGNYGDVLEIPAKVTYRNAEWKVTSIESNVLSSGPDLCAIIWNPETAFTENVSNPNLLLYVKSANYAPQSIKNVIVNNVADNITLIDAADGNNFYCPQEFTAKSISYTHHYKMETGVNESKGWETIALPFDVQRITHKSKGEIVPFANWKSGDSKKPFWLKQLGSSGWTDAQSIKAYTPYIISMPNHTKYKEVFKLNGDVTFSGENVKIGKTENLTTSSFNGRTFVPNFTYQTDKSYYALNVNNDYVDYQGNRREGSMFYIGLRDIHPFEAYMTTVSGTRAIAIEDDITTGIEEIKEMLDEQKDIKVYNLKGQLIKSVEGKTMDELAKMLPAGIYIVNGQKLIIK